MHGNSRAITVCFTKGARMNGGDAIQSAAQYHLPLLEGRMFLVATGSIFGYAI